MPFGAASAVLGVLQGYRSAAWSNSTIEGAPAALVNDQLWSKIFNRATGTAYLGRVVEQLDDDALTIYTDGSSYQHPRRGGIGFRFVWTGEDGHEVVHDSKASGYKQATNNQMDEHTAFGLLAEGVSDETTQVVSSRGRGTTIAWATVTREVPLGASRVLITVACYLTGGGERWLTVPVAHGASSRPAVQDLPSLAPPPQPGAVVPEKKEPLVDASARRLVKRFLAEYLAGSSSSSLAYYLTSGTRLAPMSHGLELAGVDAVDQFGTTTHDGSVAVGALVRVRDESLDSVYPLRYRLRLVRTGRWYVAAVEGWRRT